MLLVVLLLTFRVDLTAGTGAPAKRAVRDLIAVPAVQATLCMAVAFYVTVGMFEAIWALLLKDHGAETWLIGLTPRTARPDFGFGGAWLDAGGQQVHLIQGDVPPNVGQHFALAVDDLDAVIDELRAQGVEVSDAMAVGPGRQAFTQDPAGNTVELNQPPA